MAKSTRVGGESLSLATGPVPELLRFILGGSTVLLLLFALMLRWPGLAWLVFGLLAPLVVVLASRRPEPDPFNIIKAASVALASLAVLVALVLGPGHPGPIATVIVVVFGLNILEATVSDALRGRWRNAATGLILLVTIPSPTGIEVPGDRPGVMLYAIEPLWLAAYTLWNWAFVAGRTPRLTKVHAAVLVAPLLAELCLPGLWAQARAYTLGCQQLFGLGLPQTKQRFDIRGHDDALGNAERACELIALFLGVWMIWF